MRVKTYLIIMLLFPLIGSASMRENTIGVNHQTKECSSFIAGDECTRCTLPVGFVEAEFINGSFTCPAGYTDNTNKTRYDSICTQLKSGFCCEESHSGSSGDCEDLIVNNKTKKCAVVEDINNCKDFPFGWERAAKHSSGDRYCPSGYEWGKVTCPTSGDNKFSN